MSCIRQPSPAWVAGVVLTAIICANAANPDPGLFREPSPSGPLLSQAVLRGAPGAAWKGALRPP
ncbi:MAG: hypothetical protein PHF00_13605, partial [Elusimicrobia bacterium]|nr:hypothetical protein [Elusimicrobiota bacterium]